MYLLLCALAQTHINGYTSVIKLEETEKEKTEKNIFGLCMFLKGRF